MKCLFLGYNDKKTKLIKFLKEKKIRVKQIDNNLLEKDIEEADIVISFGFQKLIKKEIIDKFKRPAINLHMSFLPYNRGSYPNFWSFVNETPKGVTIHEIDGGADTGNIIFQNSYELDPNLEKFSTFRKTYDFLFSELENLFIEKYEDIIKNNYKSKKQVGKFSIHKDTDLPSDMNDWDTNILDYLQREKK
tara:strand:- start:26813 stop:27385 length:573 start_codon:yes stop_codon:yes gene_type:complete